MAERTRKDAPQAAVCREGAYAEHGEARLDLLHPQAAELRGGPRAHRSVLDRACTATNCSSHALQFCNHNGTFCNKQSIMFCRLHALHSL